MSTNENTWNIPDWKDPTKYPNPEITDPFFWKWQFLRRSTDYRTTWLEEWATLEQKGQKEPLFGRFIRCDSAKTYKLTYLLDPCFPTYRSGHGVMEIFRKQESPVMPTWRKSTDQGDGFEVSQAVNDFVRDATKEGAFLAKIDPVSSLAKQMKEIRAAAEAYLKEFEIPNPAGTRQKQDVYPLYLRILDAVDVGVGWPEITDIFQKEYFKSEEEGPSGHRAILTEQDSHDLYRDAVSKMAALTG